MPVLCNASCSRINRPSGALVRVNIRPVSRLQSVIRANTLEVMEQDSQQERLRV